LPDGSGSVSWALMLAGLAGLGWMGRRRKAAA